MVDVISPEQLRDVLRTFMDAHSLKAKPWCDKAGVSPNLLYNFFREDSQGIRLDIALKLAQAAGVSISEMLGGPPDSRDIERVFEVDFNPEVLGSVVIEVLNEFIKTGRKLDRSLAWHLSVAIVEEYKKDIGAH